MLSANPFFLALYLGSVSLLSEAISVSEIQGDSFLSPYEGQILHDVYGILVAKVRLLICTLRGETRSRYAQHQTTLQM